MKQIAALFLIMIASFSLVAEAGSRKLRIGDKFPAFRLNHLVSKKPFPEKSVVGKIALIDFWGSDCAPCRESIPELNILFKEFKGKNFEMIGINVDEDNQDTKNFLSEFKPAYTLLDDQKHSLIKTLGVEQMPTTYLVDQKGIIRFINKGFRSGDREILKKQINGLIMKSR